MRSRAVCLPRACCFSAATASGATVAPCSRACRSATRSAVVRVVGVWGASCAGSVGAEVPWVTVRD